jgi:hypothetical protein
VALDSGACKGQEKVLLINKTHEQLNKKHVQHSIDLFQILTMISLCSAEF